jgi:hypothetical protein
MNMVIDDDMEHIDTNKEMDIDGYTLEIIVDSGYWIVPKLDQSDIGIELKCCLISECEAFSP